MKKQSITVRRGRYYRTSLRNTAIYKHYPQSQSIVIFIHGIIEGPKQFRRLGQIAYEEGLSIDVLLLPGHGGSGEAFGRTCYKEWIEYVSLQVQGMKKRYQNIILAGHSMGALLALCETAAFPEQIIGLVLMDTPLILRLWPRVVKGAVKIIKDKGQGLDAYTRAEYHAISVNQTTPRGYLKWMMRYLELFSLVRYTRKQIKKVKVPLLLIFAAKDEFVSLKGRKYFAEKEELRGEMTQKAKEITELILKDSGHFCYHHEDLLQLEDTFRRFIKKMRC